MKKRKGASNTASQRKLADDWEKLKAKWANVPPLASKVPRTKKPVEPADVFIGIQHTPREGEVLVKQLKARSHTTPGGSTAPAKQLVYTGDKMLGTATMHKSNTVPVFSQDDVESIAKMRR